MTNKFAPVDIFCQCCYKLLGRVDNEDDAFNAGLDIDTHKQDESIPTFCEECGHKFQIPRQELDKIDIEKRTEQEFKELKSKSVIGTIYESNFYHMTIYSKEKLKKDNFRF